jgi:hypothetical protein
MGVKQIIQLPAASTYTPSADVFAIQQSGTTRHISGSQLPYATTTQLSNAVANVVEKEAGTFQGYPATIAEVSGNDLVTAVDLNGGEIAMYSIESIGGAGIIAEATNGMALDNISGSASLRAMNPGSGVTLLAKRSIPTNGDTSLVLMVSPYNDEPHILMNAKTIDLNSNAGVAGATYVRITPQDATSMPANLAGSGDATSGAVIWIDNADTRVKQGDNVLAYISEIAAVSGSLITLIASSSGAGGSGVFLPLSGGAMAGAIVAMGISNPSSGSVTNQSFGTLAGQNPGGTQNTSVGYVAGRDLPTGTGSANTLIGSGAGIAIKDGSSNTGVGQSALGNASAGAAGSNVAVGALALYTATNPQGVVAIGSGSMATTHASPKFSVAVGHNSLNTVSGDNNVAIGYMAGFGVRGAHNIYVGKYAGNNITGNNELWINSTDTTAVVASGDSFIYGQMDAGRMWISGKEVVTSANISGFAVSGDITRSEVAGVTGSLQTQINGVSQSLSGYTTLAATAALTGNLQGQINAIVQEGTSITSSAGTINVSNAGLLYNVEVVDYIGKSEVAAVSGSLQTQITGVSQSLSGYTPLATTAAISSTIDGKANDATVVHVTGNESIDGVKSFVQSVFAGYSEYGSTYAEIGVNRPTDGPAYIDMHAVSGTGYSARLLRGTGTNGILHLYNTGNGGLQIHDVSSTTIDSLATSAGQLLEIGSGGLLQGSGYSGSSLSSRINAITGTNILNLGSAPFGLSSLVTLDENGDLQSSMSETNRIIGTANNFAGYLVYDFREQNISGSGWSFSNATGTATPGLTGGFIYQPSTTDSYMQRDVNVFNPYKYNAISITYKTAASFTDRVACQFYYYDSSFRLVGFPYLNPTYGEWRTEVINVVTEADTVAQSVSKIRFDLMNNSSSESMQIGQIAIGYLGEAFTPATINVSGYGMLDRTKLVSPQERVLDLGNISGAFNIDLSLANYFTLTLTGTASASFTNPPVNLMAQTATVMVNQAGYGNNNITWINTRWAGGTAATLTSGGLDMLNFVTYNAGGFYIGTASIKDIR